MLNPAVLWRYSIVSQYISAAWGPSKACCLHNLVMSATLVVWVQLHVLLEFNIRFQTSLSLGASQGAEDTQHNKLTDLKHWHSMPYGCHRWHSREKKAYLHLQQRHKTKKCNYFHFVWSPIFKMNEYKQKLTPVKWSWVRIASLIY